MSGTQHTNGSISVRRPADNDEATILRLQNAAGELRATVENTLLAHPILSQSHLRVSSRVKTLGRAYAKLTGSRSQRPEATAYDLDDLLGFRFVALFNTNLVEILTAILDLVSDSKSSLFDPQHCRAVIYAARPDTDPLSIRATLTQLFDSEDRKIQYDTHQLGTLYSSVHLIVKCPVKLQKIDGSYENHRFPVELQFRTAMEDVWSQVSHITRYSRRESTQLDPIGDHLNALKQLIDGCALYAGLIQVDANRSLAASREINEKPLSARDLMSGELRDVPPDIQDAYQAAIDKQTLATKVREQSDPTAGNEFFAEAAAAFAAVEDKIRRQVKAPADADAIYRVQMERAFCLLYCDTVKALDDAFTIYETLARQNANDAIVQLRLGQTRKRRNDLEGSKASLETARSLLTTLENSSPFDPSRIVRSVHMELGAVYFELSTQTPEPAAKRVLLDQALDSARAWLDCVDPNDKADVLGATNNILYFSWDQLRQFGSASLSKAELQQLMSRLDADEIATFVAAPKHDAIYDTVCRLHGHLGDKKKEIEAAGKVVAAIKKKIGRRAGRPSDTLTWPEIDKQLTADEMDSYQYALLVISRSVPYE